MKDAVSSIRKKASPGGIIQQNNSMNVTNIN